MGFSIGYVIGVIIVSIICGLICKAIASNRGMDGGFWWGFFLWIIGIIVVAVRPNDKLSYQTSSTYTTNSDTSTLDSFSSRENNREERILLNGGWKCDKCGNVNHDYTLFCLCGNPKPAPLEPKSKTNTDIESKKENSSVYLADEIRKLKELADDGIITQEEFEAKKKQLLGL